MRAPDPAATARLRLLAGPPPAAGPDVGIETEQSELDVTEEIPLAWAPPATLAEHVRAAVHARLPAPLQGGRWQPGRRGVLLVAALGVAAVGLAVGWAAHGRPHPVAPATAVAAVAPAGDDPLTAVPDVQVDVEGRVRRPGLVTLPTGARIADAIKAAGGALPGTDTSGLDLAQKVTDGQQLRVGAPAAAATSTVAGPAPGASGAAAEGTPGAAGGLIDLNTATADQLDALPRVGPATAQKIIDYRTAHGAFTSVSQLQQIAGIGPATYQQIAPLVTV